MRKAIFNIIVVLFVTQLVAAPTLFLTVETTDKIEVLPENDSENNLNGEGSDTKVLFDNDFVKAPTTEWCAEFQNTHFNSFFAVLEDISLGVNHVPPEH